MPGMILLPHYSSHSLPSIVMIHIFWSVSPYHLYLSSLPLPLTILSNTTLGTKIPKLIIPPTNKKFASVDLGVCPLGTHAPSFLLLQRSLCFRCVFRCPSLSKCGTSFSSPRPNGACPGPI